MPGPVPAIGNTDVDRRAGLYPPIPWALVWPRCSVVWPLICSNISKYREEYQERSDVFCRRPVNSRFPTCSGKLGLTFPVEMPLPDLYEMFSRHSLLTVVPR